VLSFLIKAFRIGVYNLSHGHLNTSNVKKQNKTTTTKKTAEKTHEIGCPRAEWQLE